MPLDLGITFPSEAEALRKQALAEQSLTPTQRLLAVVDILAAADTLSQIGGVRVAQLKYQQRLEDECRCRIREFIEQHVGS